jgi:hypothetical protein
MKVEASEEIRMERKNGNITPLMLGASTCSENRVSRLIPHLRQATIMGFSAMTLLILASTAQAGLITNGSFTSVGTDPFTGVAYTSSYTLFTGNLPSWTYDSANGSLDCLVFPGTALTNPCGQNPNSAGVFTNQGTPLWSDPGPVPGGGNYLAVDGDPSLSVAISQTITGLTPNQAYTVSFFQGAAQAIAESGTTTEKWLVSFDTVGTGGTGGTSCSLTTLYTGSTTCESQLSNVMNNASKGSVGWTSPQSFQSLTFIAQNAKEVLSFYAEGTPPGLPPVVLLGDVSVSASPEPATCVLVGGILLGLGIARRRLNKRA